MQNKEWIDQLSDWLDKREEFYSSDSLLNDLQKEIDQTVHETNSLLEESDRLQSVCSNFLAKVDHGSS